MALGNGSDESPGHDHPGHGHGNDVRWHVETDSTPSGCGAIDGAAAAGTWYILTLKVSGTVASTTLQGTLSDAAGGNVKTIGPCTATNGLAAGWAGVGVRGGGTQGEWDDVQITGIMP